MATNSVNRASLSQESRPQAHRSDHHPSPGGMKLSGSSDFRLFGFERGLGHVTTMDLEGSHRVGFATA